MLEVIEKRRSCRKFDSERMPEMEKIEAVVKAGLNAPSAINTQGGIIIAITNKEIRDKLSAVNMSFGARRPGDPFYGAPVVLLVAVKKWPLAVYDGSVMIENMLLEATNQGLGSCWIHRAKEELESAEGRELLSSIGIDLEEYEGIGHVILGYSLIDEYPPKQIKENREFWIK